jgi:hypothetical protein
MMDTHPSAADMQDILDFAMTARHKTRTPEARAMYSQQFEQLKARVNLADPIVQKQIEFTQRVVNSAGIRQLEQCASETLGQKGRGGKAGGKAGKMESPDMTDMTELELDDLAAEINAMPVLGKQTKPKKGNKKRGK